MSITLNNQNTTDFSVQFAYQIKCEVLVERLEELGFSEERAEYFYGWIIEREPSYYINNLDDITDEMLLDFANSIYEFTSSLAPSIPTPYIPNIPSISISNIPRDLDIKPFHPINFNPNVYYVDPNESESEEDDDESEQVEDVYQESDAEAEFERNCLNLRFRGRYRRSFIPSNNLPSQ